MTVKAAEGPSRPPPAGSRADVRGRTLFEQLGVCENGPPDLDGLTWPPTLVPSLARDGHGKAEEVAAPCVRLPVRCVSSGEPRARSEPQLLREQWEASAVRFPGPGCAARRRDAPETLFTRPARGSRRRAS